MKRYGPLLLVLGALYVVRSVYVNRAAIATRWADATGAYTLGKGWAGALAAFVGIDR